MQAKIDKDRKSIINQINTILTKRMPAGAARQAGFFSEIYFKRVPMTDLHKNSPVFLATMVAEQIKFMQQRQPGELLIRVINPDKEKAGADKS